MHIDGSKMVISVLHLGKQFSCFLRHLGFALKNISSLYNFALLYFAVGLRFSLEYFSKYVNLLRQCKQKSSKNANFWQLARNIISFCGLKL